jgi:hypothetical protein
MDNDQHGYTTLAKTGSVVNGATTTPASGATVVLYQSNLPTAAGRGSRYKMLVINIISSADSAASGVTIDESSDGGATWQNLSAQSFTYLTASGYVKTYVKVSAPELRVRYANSAATLSTWSYSIMGDNRERANG